MSCMFNHGVRLGSQKEILDGCQVFIPSPQSPRLCEVCGCHKGFHLTEHSVSHCDESATTTNSAAVPSSVQPQGSLESFVGALDQAKQEFMNRYNPTPENEKRCPHCWKCFRSNNIIPHLRRHGNFHKLECEFCLKKFEKDQPRELLQHILDSHFGHEKPYWCKCSFTTASDRAFVTHISKCPKSKR
jgi:hypothetical protein